MCANGIPTCTSVAVAVKVGQDSDPTRHIGNNISHGNDCSNYDTQLDTDNREVIKPINIFKTNDC